MNQPNFYQPPSSQSGISATQVSQDSGFASLGKLVARQGFISPPVCIVTGVPVDPLSRPKTISVSYYSLWAIILIVIGLLFGLIIGLILCLFVRKTLKFKAYLAPEIAKKNRLNILVAWAFFFIGFLSIAFAVFSPLFGAFGVIFFVLAIYFGFSRNKYVKFIRYTKPYFELAGVHPNFLAQLPQAQSPSYQLFANMPAAPTLNKVSSVPEGQIAGGSGPSYVPPTQH